MFLFFSYEQPAPIIYSCNILLYKKKKPFSVIFARVLVLLVYMGNNNNLYLRHIVYTKADCRVIGKRDRWLIFYTRRGLY